MKLMNVAHECCWWIMLINDADRWCLSKQEPHDQSVLFTQFLIFGFQLFGFPTLSWSCFWRTNDLMTSNVTLTMTVLCTFWYSVLCTFSRHMSRSSGCPACDLPLCMLDCPLRPKHQSYECPLFENSRLNFAFRWDPPGIFTMACLTFFYLRNEKRDYVLSQIPYDAIMILRLLLIKDLRPEDWKTFKLLQCSLDEWREMHPWEENQEEKINIIREKLKQKKFSREDILKVNILNTCIQVCPFRNKIWKIS